MLAVETSAERAVTIRRYSELTGLSLMTCYRYAQTGKVPARQFLGRWLVYLPQAEQHPQSEGQA